MVYEVPVGAELLDVFAELRGFDAGEGVFEDGVELFGGGAEVEDIVAGGWGGVGGGFVFFVEVVGGGGVFVDGVFVVRHRYGGGRSMGENETGGEGRGERGWGERRKYYTLSRPHEHESAPIPTTYVTDQELGRHAQQRDDVPCPVYRASEQTLPIPDRCVVASSTAGHGNNLVAHVPEGID